MRKSLNSNPLAQVAVIGVLLVATGFFVVSSMGSGSSPNQPAANPAATTAPAGATATTPSGASAAPSGTTTTSSTATSPSTATAGTASTPAAASVSGATVPSPPLPHPVIAAFSANETVVLLIVKEGGIEDRMVTGAVHQLSSLPRVATFVVPASRIARYAAIAQGVSVDRVPALVVVRPKRLDHGIPTASVSYGFQSPESVAQAVRDATYKGRTLSYHP